MFSFWEITIILIITLIVVGPEKLPELAKKIGGFIRKTKLTVNNLKEQVEQQLDINDIEKDIMEENEKIKNIFNEKKQKIEKSINKKN